MSPEERIKAPKHLAYLDSILTYLRGGIQSSYIFGDLFKVLQKNNISFDSQLESEFNNLGEGELNTNGANLEGFRKQVFQEAIIYLDEQGLVSVRYMYENIEPTITLTYKGRVKIGSNFVQEYRKSKVKQNLTNRLAIIQIITIPITIAISVIAIYFTTRDSANPKYVHYHRKVIYNYPCRDNPTIVHVKDSIKK